MGYRNTAKPWQFGDGGDGPLHVQADAFMTKAELNLTTLEIDATFTLSAKKMSESQQPLVIIRCLTPLILNGTISLDEIGGALDDDNGGLIEDQEYGQEAAIFRVGSQAGFHPSSAMAIYPIASGGGDSAVAISGSHILSGYDAALVPAGNAGGASIFTGDLANLIGPGKLFEIGIGCGGAPNGDADPIALGGGAIRIYAPGIIFGASGAITAHGGDGADQAVEDAAGGGGGGGYIETWTKTPIVDDDWNGVTSGGVTVAGGTGGTGTSGTATDGGDGMDGHVVRRIIR